MRRVFSLFLVMVCSFAAAGEPAPIAPSPAAQALAEPEAPKADKSCYHLFKPTPRELMREMSTDRPDQTESPYTVDAGHFQVEWDLFSFTRDRKNPDNDGSRADTYSFGGTNFKMGLTNRIDLQFVFEPHLIERSRARNEDGEIFHETKQGFGDLTTRLKINVFGNDGGKLALAVMPFVKIPTNQDELGNDDVEAGLIIPLAVELPKGWGMGIMTELDIVRDDDDNGHHTEFFNTITFSHDIIGNLAGYIEFAALFNSQDGSNWVGQVDAGMTYGITENIQVDWGVNVGVTRAADDVQPFLGLTVRW